ncbi:hypothetical protein Ciccas_006641 [Cichlidogyrus casuarinus]|uniref:Uncharacterized protein n=1 Tax=Cichlidogyrus casuarinus TaxID=1844966 RepID=A0ABD2Q686_9PLAT
MSFINSLGYLQAMAFFNKPALLSEQKSRPSSDPSLENSVLNFKATITLDKSLPSIKQRRITSESDLISLIEDSKSRAKECFVKCFNSSVHVKDHSLLGTDYEREIRYSQMQCVYESRAQPLALLIELQLKPFEIRYLTFHFVKKGEKKKFMQLLTRKLGTGFLRKLEPDETTRRRFSTSMLEHKRASKGREEKYIKHSSCPSQSLNSRSQFYRQKWEDSRKNSVTDDFEEQLSQFVKDANSKKKNHNFKKPNIFSLFFKNHAGRRRSSSASSGIEADRHSDSTNSRKFSQVSEGFSEGFAERKVSQISNPYLDELKVYAENLSDSQSRKASIDFFDEVQLDPRKSDSNWHVRECRINTGYNGTAEIDSEGSNYLFCASTSKFFNSSL